MSGNDAIHFPSADSFDIQLEEGFVEWSIEPDKLPLVYVEYANGGGFDSVFKERGNPYLFPEFMQACGKPKRPPRHQQPGCEAEVSGRNLRRNCVMHALGSGIEIEAGGW